ncbi:hypothetical protein GCM10022237_04380 [Nocardioides ginsengisoli]|uniref:DUF6174 domain-containing protein n=1 Tax=Nocardioides ginsengisoli TaxID=363868 RepID=A0ABW3VW45_9ACTN
MSSRARLLPVVPLLLLPLSACGHENDDRATDSIAPAPAPSATESPSGTPESTGRYPAFAATDYVYRLEVMCFCPQVGPVKVRVEGGKVAGATALSGDGRGKPAPDYTRLSINDIIAMANDPAAAKVEVTWPDGQDHPTSVAVDRIANATDDEVTYTIKNVRVLP